MLYGMVSAFLVHPGVIAPSRRVRRWNLCSARRGVLKMEQRSQSKVEAEKFSVRNALGVTLSCVMDKDATLDSRAPLYVLVHGYRDSKYGKLVSSVAAELNARGRRTVRFDCTGNGESGGEFTYSNYRGEAEDLRSVIEHVRGDGEEIAGIVGHSKGAGVVLIYAEKYGDVPTVAALAPRFHMSTGVVERFGDEVINQVRQQGQVEVTAKDGFKFILTKHALDDRLSLDMGAVARGIPKNCSVVVVHGDADSIIPVSHANDFVSELKCTNKKEIIQGAGHGFRGFEMQVVDAFFFS